MSANTKYGDGVSAGAGFAFAIFAVLQAAMKGDGGHSKKYGEDVRID